MKIIKPIFIMIAVFCIALLAALYMKGGDLLLKYLADSVGVKLTYENRCTFLDAFLLKKTAVKQMRLTVPEADFAITCADAHIEFDYTETIAKGAIRLRWYLDKPILEIDEGYFDPEDLGVLDVMPDAIFPILWQEALSQYESIHCDLSFYGKTIEVHSLMIISDNMTINARGVGNKKGSVESSLSFFFKPKFVKILPEEILEFLEPAPNGWASFNIKIKADMTDKSLELESDNFKLVIGTKG